VVLCYVTTLYMDYLYRVASRPRFHSFVIFSVYTSDGDER